MTQSPTINTVDNNLGNCIIDNEVKDKLDVFAGISLDSIAKQHPNILVYPPTLDKKSDLNSYPIYDIHYRNVDNGQKTYALKTNNIMGFLSVNQVSLNICSRFTSEDAVQSSEDYFMHYMLMKTLHVNIVDLFSEYTFSSVFDYLTLLFPSYLDVAFKQGVYKEYVQYEHNNHNLKGAIDINRQISRNTPFNGKVAYRTRELSYDNSITQLVRHTVEYIQCTHLGYIVLQSNKDIVENVHIIRSCTTAYDYGARHKIIGKNLKPLAHPYFTAYKDLQALCVMILQHNQFKYKNDTAHNIHGVLFNGAWLWESYLDKLFKEHMLGFVHPNNITKKDSISVFKTNKWRKMYPDFYKKEDDFAIVLDAKYKRVDYGPQSKDLHQMIAYMYLLEANAHHEAPCGKAALLYPSNMEQINDRDELLEGYGGHFMTLALRIPKHCKSYSEFVEKMVVAEKDFVSRIRVISAEHQQILEPYQLDSL